jgi:ribonuclease D
LHPERSVRLIRGKRELSELRDILASATVVAADTEAAGYHHYHDSICLLQLATAQGTFVVDTLALTNLDILAAVLEDRSREIIFHDADYDVRLLHRDFGLRVRGLFDTKLAAQFLGEASLSLAGLLQRRLDITIEKKYQRADWARRPLPREMLQYAAEDVRYLPALRDTLAEALRISGRAHWAEEEFRLLEDVRWEPESQANDAFLRLKGARDLDRRSLAALRELFTWRETTAETRDVAPFRVVGNDVLVAVAQGLPRDAAAMAALPGVGPGVARRWGEPMLQAVRKAARLPQAEWPRRPPRSPRPARDPELEQRLERVKAERDAAARELGLERGFLMPRSQLEAVARARPLTLAELAAVPSIRRWQVEALGERLVRALSQDRTRHR